jgi:hypothetical protein
VGFLLKSIEGIEEVVSLGRLDSVDNEGIELGDVEGISTKVGFFTMGDSETSVGFLDLIVGKILGVLLGNRLLASVGSMLGILEVGISLSGRKLGNLTGITEIGGVDGPLATTGLSVNGESE